MQHEIHIEMVYPEQQSVSVEQVKNWLCDAIANNEVDDPLLSVDDVKTLPVEDILIALGDSGKFTFAKPRYYNPMTKLYD